jgi:hypothetical protein
MSQQRKEPGIARSFVEIHISILSSTGWPIRQPLGAWTSTAGNNLGVFVTTSVLANVALGFVVSKPAHFGIARQIAAYYDRRSKVEVFYEWTAALRWLGPNDISCPMPVWVS